MDNVLHLDKIQSVEWGKGVGWYNCNPDPKLILLTTFGSL